MELPVFFLETYSNSDVLTLSEAASKHIIQVLRMKPFERLQLTDGAGNLLTAEIMDDHKKNCTVSVIEKKLFPKKNQEICIGISLIKNINRFEWFVEKATEIGVTEIIPLLCDRTEKQHFRYDRLKQILISAMIQSKQVWLPVLQNPGAFKTVISSSVYQKKLIAHCKEDKKQSIKNFSSVQSVQILVGPEGDFSADEISQSLQMDYLPVTLGNTRLRSETAGVAAAVLLCS